MGSFSSQNMPSVKRTAKTLLLCKLKPDKARESSAEYYSRQYERLYMGIGGTKYITMGNVDAISIYNTVDNAEESPNWFEKILDDRKMLIRKTDDNVNYHPIHLVANRRYDSFSPRRSFCVVSLIYGIYHGTNDEYHWTEKLRDTEVYLSSISNYEAKLHNFFSNQCIPDNTSYEIYNAVNICDAVIIWNTDNLLDVLKLSGKLNHYGFARKTFTLVGFLWDGESKKICDKVHNLLKKSTEKYSVRIQGSIRNQTEYYKVIESAKKDAAQCGISLQDTKDFIICGQSDFSVLLADIDGFTLSWLLDFYMCDINSKAISNACWEVHTELMYKLDHDNSLSIINDPTSILNIFFKSDNNSLLFMEEYPWFGAFYELLSVHANIDKHPILYGPGYCIFYFLLISFWFFEKCSEPQYKEMLTKSRDSIQEYIRGWSNFTDQLLRIDDLVFHGFGNSTALYSTLPECALDFYHSLILSFVNLLVDVDKSVKRIGEQRESYLYDFLLLPKLDRGVSIKPMFDIGENPQGKPGDIRTLWPEKQAFLVYFPIEAVFSPVRFFAPLVHECFHYLGDACRLRDRRFQYIGRFISVLIMDKLNHNNNTPKDNALCECIIQKLCEVSSSLQVREPNAIQTQYILNQKKL